MPRQNRLLVDNCYYHVLTRGNDKKKIFRSRKDYVIFLKIVAEYLHKFKIHILHYCLMKNHIHLLIHAEKAKDLPKFMQGILQTYGSYFRKNYNSVGFVFQNRYKSHFIDKESYLLECARYIERNPLRAEFVADLFSYSWSSFLFYAKGKNDMIVNKANLLYSQLGETPQIRQQRYRDYVLEERPYEDIVDKGLRI